MSNILINPLANEVIKLNGIIKNNTKVNSLIEKDNKIIGVETNKDKYFAKNIIINKKWYTFSNAPL